MKCVNYQTLLWISGLALASCATSPAVSGPAPTEAAAAPAEAPSPAEPKADPVPAAAEPPVAVVAPSSETVDAGTATAQKEPEPAKGKAKSPEPASAAAAAPVAKKVAAPAGPDPAGLALFEKKCGTCHGADGRGKTKMGEKMQVKDFTAAAIWRGQSDEAIFKNISEGMPEKKMPSYKGKLSADEIKLLVKTLRAMAR